MRLHWMVIKELYLHWMIFNKRNDATPLYIKGSLGPCLFFLLNATRRFGGPWMIVIKSGR